MSAAGDVCPQVRSAAGATLGLLPDPSDTVPSKRPEPFLIRLEHIVLPPNVPAGLSPWTLFAVGGPRRNGGHQVCEPIKVRRHPDWPGGWQIVDGRHRYVASVMAGCADVLCVEVP